MDSEIREKHKTFKDRFIRWQQLTIAQLSFTNNLVLGLNLGILGFLLTQSALLFDRNPWIFLVQLLALAGIATSFISGIFLAINRLNDFRLTTQLIRKRKEKFEIEQGLREAKNSELLKTEISNLSTKIKSQGKTTWILLKCQIWAFMLGTIFGLVYIVMIQNISG